MTATTTGSSTSSSLALTREQDVMTTSFTISGRGEHDVIPERDARRVGQMRRLAKARLAYCGLPELAEDVELLVSELVTNAIKHSRGTEITMTLRLGSGVLRLGVSDRTGRFPQIQQPNDDAEGGRGLQLVQCITQQHGGTWGFSPDGASTWCKIPTTPAGSC